MANLYTVVINLTNVGFDAGPFDVLYSTDGGLTFTLIASNVPASSFTGGGYFISNLPDNANLVQIKSDGVCTNSIITPVLGYPTNCSASTTTTSSTTTGPIDLCIICDFGFTSVSDNAIGKLTLGSLTSTCENTLTDYVINWYGPDSNINLAFTTGAGGAFTYQYPQPFGGNSAVPLQSGTYYPEIDTIIITGTTYSQSGYPGSTPANLDCLSPINILAFKCDNQSNTNSNYPLSAYNHNIKFVTNISSGLPSITTTLEISASTKYIPIAFKGENAPDRLTIYFSGQNYSTLIGLEDVSVGQLLLTSDFNLGNFPLSAATNQFYNKIITLTALTVSDGDKILIEIQPSVQNTNWDLYFSCLETFDCVDCLTDTSYYKIIGSTITSSVTPCGVNTVDFRVSGCTFETFRESDYVKYYTNSDNNSTFVQNAGFPFTSLGTVNYWGGVSPELPSNQITPACRLFSCSNYFSSVICQGQNRTTLGSDCAEDLQPTYYQWKTGGTNNFRFTADCSIISAAYSQWNNLKNNTIGGYLYSSNPNDIRYFGIIYINIPNPLTPDACADPTFYNTFPLHPSCPIETGVTGSQCFLSITAVTINDITSNTCDLGCTAATSFAVSQVNSVTGTSPFYFAYTSGYHYQSFVSNYWGSTSGVTFNNPTAREGFFRTWEASLYTYPFSGNPKTLIPSLYSPVCNNYLNGSVQILSGTARREYHKYKYFINLTNPLNPADFEISANTITNGSLDPGSFVLAYKYQGGVVTFTNPTYVI